MKFLRMGWIRAGLTAGDSLLNPLHLSFQKGGRPLIDVGSGAVKHRGQCNLSCCNEVMNSVSFSFHDRSGDKLVVAETQRCKSSVEIDCLQRKWEQHPW